MKKFIGVKVINAEPMNLGVYNKYRGWTIPSDEDPKKDGYLVVYMDGYESWSPKEIFEEAYRETTGITFGLAVEAMKKGLKVARSGWNGKDMYAVYMPGYPEGVQVNEITQKQHGVPEGTKFVYRPYFQLYTAQKDVAMWSPSTSDSLADDWFILK